MNPRLFLDVDPRTLQLPNSRLTGADPVKLQRQIARHGQATQGMPVVEVYRGTDGELVIYNGVSHQSRQAASRTNDPCRSDRRSEDTRWPLTDRGRHAAINAEREQLLRLLAELSEADHELRLGQLIANLATLADGAKPEAIWDAEDEELLGAAKRLLAHYRARDVTVAS